MTVFSLQGELRRLSSANFDEAKCANNLAGTEGFELVHALNVWAETSGLGVEGACNAKAGTSGFGAALALSKIVGE